ncbi:unnamed protein product [Symbiodinium sp. CCMP2456]|nr:unnamed protein product [Symbiodinium sp. CCMP2456]
MGLPSPWFLSVLSGVLCVHADKPADPTLPGMVGKILAGDFDNNFFDGDLLKGPPSNEKEEMGACLLDKVGAIVSENGVEDFLNDLQVDAAACCTKDKEECVKDNSEAYALLTSVGQKKADSKTAAPKVAAMFLRSVEKRLSADKVVNSHAHFFGKCKDVDTCTLELLGSVKRERMYRANIEQVVGWADSTAAFAVDYVFRHESAGDEHEPGGQRYRSLIHVGGSGKVWPCSRGKAKAWLAAPSLLQELLCPRPCPLSIDLVAQRPRGSAQAQLQIFLGARESAGSDVHLLRSENHFLTEKLVEASLQSAQHFEALSSNRDELRRQVQDLRTQLDSEKAQRSRFEERLASAEEILGRLTEENMRLSGNAKAPEATSPASQPEQMDRDSLWKVYTSLREKAEHLAQENEELRKLTEQRTSEANSTIMELAQRNLQLEGRLQAAQQQLEKLRGVTPNLPGSCSTTPRAASQSSRSVSRSGSAVQVRQRVDLDIERNASAQSLHSAASDSTQRMSCQTGAPELCLAQATHIAAPAKSKSCPYHLVQCSGVKVSMTNLGLESFVTSVSVKKVPFCFSFRFEEADWAGQPSAMPMSAMSASMLPQIKMVLMVIATLAAVTGCFIELLKRRLISWVDKQPWRSRMIPPQRNMMHNFGYSESITSDERVVVDCYCFLIAICSHHLVVSLALTPVAVLGWDSAGSVGQFLFYAGAVGDVAYSAYDTVQTTLRTFCPVSFKGLGVQLPKKYFIVMVCLHHTLSMMLTVPMILYYPKMRALHILMWSMLSSAGVGYLLGCYKFTLDTQDSRRDLLQFKAIVLVQSLMIWLVRGYVWLTQATSAMMVFYRLGDTLFLLLGSVGFVMMTLFNLLMVIDSTTAVVKWLPQKMHMRGHDTKRSCHETLKPTLRESVSERKELPAMVHAAGLRRVQGARVAFATQ